MARLCVLLLLLTPAFDAAGQTGRVLDNESMESSVMGTPRKYAVYLPPDYNTSSRSYPVLYLLHGSGDDQTGWVQFGEVLHIADRAIRSGSATPMVIVMPNAHDPNRGYFNRISGDWNYEDFFFEELMPHVEAKYRVKGEKRYRAIAGLSMGGGGAFIYALHRPDLFSSACPLSAYVGPLSLEAYRERAEQRGEEVDKLEGHSYERVEAHYKRHSVLELLAVQPLKARTNEEGRNRPESARTVRWYIDCGDDDFLYEGNSLAHIAMRKAEIDHEYRVRQGGHNWTYWRESLPEVLRFVSQAFHQH
ncbi:Endo-1,4-beta-xylanase Z precursor [Pseudobythopirellula maris]|uniref:Endo-1,4-beta-xylanase Z n=1 Tax=Pseudobythopirellula maris TaxID=2527991 RepID=A0A5C5ZHR2_9BACT|nr:alpha/beta hydrolase-fold protein [Pseudobythopirellula maris]TWT86894.1 Endo-1,4-beta-xylanase Z precursor [Pseudobythopirellula maris]